MKTKEYFTYEGITYEITKTEIIVNGECKNYTISSNALQNKYDIF